MNAEHPINSIQLLLPFYGLSLEYCFLPNALRNPLEDLNQRTISLELLGRNFDHPEHRPTPQLVANTVGTIFAFMNRYPGIKFSNILGHFEIQADKADPGKKFMAELRLTLALKVLESGSQRLKEDFFGPFMTDSGNLTEATKRFFDFQWDRVVSSYWGHPKAVLDWEKQTGFWNIYYSLFRGERPQAADRFSLPISAGEGRRFVYGHGYASPEYHEGLDFNIQSERRLTTEDLGTLVSSVANGKVIFAGEIPGSPGLGRTVVVEHILPQGAKVLSLYAHLDEITTTKGQVIEIGEQIATLGSSGGQVDPHLHFALMPAATQRERELNHYLQLSYQGEEVNAYTEDTSGRIFIVQSTTRRPYIESHYFNPLEFLSEHS